MVNIWDFAWNLGKVKIVTNDGQTFIGDTLCVDPAEEADDEEDSITIEMKDGRIIGFHPSEISSIERI